MTVSLKVVKKSPTDERTMAEFIGRPSQINELEDHLARVAGAIGEPKAGRCILLRGRRRVSKSRLVEEFTQRVGLPTLYFTASHAKERELEMFATEVEPST